MKVQMHFIDWNLVKVYTNSAMHFVAIHQYIPSCRLLPSAGTGIELGPANGCCYGNSIIFCVSDEFVD